MALSNQQVGVQTLVTFCLWAKRQGFQVGEMYGFSKVHRVHSDKSWHYDKQGKYGKAADINWPGGGAPERTRLLQAVNVAHELGLSTIYAKDGKAGPAAGHQGHLHVDVGSYSHLGKEYIENKSKGDVVTDKIQRAVGLKPDQVWGPITDSHVEAVRAAAMGNFPYGVRFVQGIVKVDKDNVWGKDSRAALAKAVKAIQSALGVKPDATWGKNTDTAYRQARSIRLRR